MEHFKSRNNDYFHFTNPHDDGSDLDDDDDYDHLQYHDIDDDRSCDFNFHTFHPLGITQSPLPDFQASRVKNQTGTEEEFGAFDKGALIFHLDNTMKTISDKLQHTIQDIGTKISVLEDETCKLDKYVEDVKNSVERYHGVNHGKLRQMHSLLQEVHDDVLFLRDKHEIAETKLRLSKLQDSKKDELNVIQTNPQSSKSYHMPFTFQQHPIVPPNLHFTQLNSFQETPSFQLFPSEPQRWGSMQQHEVNLTQSTQVNTFRNYKSEFHAKYMPQFTTSSNIYPHGEPSPSHEIPNVKPVVSHYNYTSVAQALPVATEVGDGSDSEENENIILAGDIIDKITGMGFRRDHVSACVMKMTETGSSVDLNSVLDKIMNNK